MLNIVYCLYNLQEELRDIHIKNWESYPEELRKQINLILVDDCSCKPFTIDIDIPINLTVARITTDMGYNIAGAKNLGLYLATNDWCFSSDIDHVLSAKECQKCIDLIKYRNCLYYFDRWFPNGEHYHKKHDNTYIIHREDFWGIGGYDENFTPHYGYEDLWLKLLMEDQGIKFINTEIKVILYNIPKQEKFLSYPIEKRKIDRKINHKVILHKIEEYKNNQYILPRPLRFKWEIVQQIKRSN